MYWQCACIILLLEPELARAKWGPSARRLANLCRTWPNNYWFWPRGWLFPICWQKWHDSKMEGCHRYHPGFNHRLFHRIRLALRQDDSWMYSAKYEV